TSAGAKMTPSAHRPPTVMIRAVATRFASRAASCLFFVVRYSVNVGTNADDRAPSANRSRVRFGIRKPKLKASITALAPNRRLMTLSRTSPVTRLIAMATDTTPAERTTLSEAGGAGRTTSPSVFFEKLRHRHDPGVIV